MASGFVNRWVGKMKIGQLWLGRSGIIQHAWVEASSIAMRATGLSIIQSGSAAQVYTIQDPIFGGEKAISLSTVSSGVFIKTLSTAVTFDGANNVFKSTVGGLLNMVGASTSRWSIAPMSTVGSALSTTT